VTYNRGRKKKKQLHIYIQETLLSKVTYKLSKKIKIKKFLPAYSFIKCNNLIRL